NLKVIVSVFQALIKIVSIGGFLLETASFIAQYCLVDFIMTVNGAPVIRPIQVAGKGEVVRAEPHGPGAGFAIAVKCKREIDLNLSELAILEKSGSRTPPTRLEATQS